MGLPRICTRQLHWQFWHVVDLCHYWWASGHATDKIRAKKPMHQHVPQLCWYLCQMEYGQVMLAINKE